MGPEEAHHRGHLDRIVGLDLLCAVATEVGEPDLAFVSDLGAPGGAKEPSDRVLAVLGRVDILVNNAGISHTRRTEKSEPDSIVEVLRINLESALLLAGALAPAMFDRGGCIVNVSSVSGVVGTPAQAIYAASKGGLDAPRGRLRANGDHGGSGSTRSPPG